MARRLPRLDSPHSFTALLHTPEAGHLQRFEGAQQGAVVDGQWVGVAEGSVGGGAAFEPGEAVGFEQAAAVAGQVELVVAGSAVHQACGRQQAAPAGAGAFEGVLPAVGGRLRRPSARVLAA